jgi:hypothetical protein
VTVPVTPPAAPDPLAVFEAPAAAALTRQGQPPARGLVLLKMGLVLVGLGFLMVWAGEGLPAERLSLSSTALILTLVLYQAALFAAALRLQGTLAACGITITARQALTIHLRSLFYFFFVPMSVGYEITRFLAVRRIDAAASVKQVVIALLLDRVLGLLAALLALAALAGVVLPAAVWAEIDLNWVLAAVLTALLLGAAAMAHGSLRRQVWGLLSALGPIWPRLALPTLYSLAALALVCASVFAFAAGSGIRVDWAPVSFALSASLLGMAIPVSLLGVTLGEVAGVGTLALIGLTPGVAVLLTSVAYCGRLFGAMQGAVIELWGDAGRVTRRA